MDLPKKIAGVEPRPVRDMFKGLMAQESSCEWNDGVPSFNPRLVSVELIETELKVSTTEGQRIQAALVAEGWIEQRKFTPTRKGMGLAQHQDREKISRDVALQILEQVVDWAKRINSDSAQRVKVKSIQLFGSLERGAPEVSDIDLFVEFTTMDLDDMDIQDWDRQDELCKELTALSEYISPSSELDRIAMDDVPTRQVFPHSPEI